MGVYLNPGNTRFQRACNSKIYVDKTAMIDLTNSLINTEQNCICISRPRRFGKSITASMLTAYYGKDCDSSVLFANYKIAKYDSYLENLNQFNVIALNMQDFLSMTKDVDELTVCVQAKVLAELREQFPNQIPEEESFLSVALEKLYSKTKEEFVFIIDEWDCILRERKYASDEHKKYLDFIRNLLKDKTYVSLAYMTGILPIKKYGTHSALNMFGEYSMTSPKGFEDYIGFTENEVKELCDEYQMDFNTMKSWYDGYTFPKAEHIYNPKSVVDALLSEEFESYWTQTETYEALKLYIDMNYDGLKDAIVRMLTGECVVINPKKFQNDMRTFQSKDDVLTLLVHLGYLAFERKKSSVYIPNSEIEGEFLNAIEGEHWKDVVDSLEKSEQILQATWNEDAQTVAQILDEVHSENTSILNYNDENSLSCVISLAYYNAMKDYTKVREFPTGKGFADIVYLPKKHSNKPAMIIELKYDKTAQGAIEQIKERRYPESLKEYHRNLLLVGINYDKATKKHSCVIEKFE